MKRRSASGLRRTETQDTYQSVITVKPFNFTHKFAEYNQQDPTFHNFFISVRRSTCFGRFFRPSSGAQNSTYSVRYFSDLPLAWSG